MPSSAARRRALSPRSMATSMSMSRRFPSWLGALALLAALPGCDEDVLRGDELKCPANPGPFTLDTSRVTGTVSLDDPPEEPLGPGERVVIRGTTHHEDGLAIREVLVGGVAAERVKFNFNQFAATLAYEDVVLAAPANPQGQVVLDAIAIDACGHRMPFAQFALSVDQTPHLRVESLALDVEYPGERTFIPADRSAAVTLVVSATGRVTGARVAISVPTGAGTFQGLDGSGRVTLVRDGPDSARAAVLFFASEPGSHVVVAEIEDRLATVLVVAAAEPAFAPDRATLVPGASMDALVLTPGTLRSCQATPSQGLEITHQGQVIGAAPVTVERVGGEYRIRVAARADATHDESVDVICVDDYGQSGSGRFELVVLDPPPAILVEALTLDVEITGDRDHLPADGSAAAVITVTGTGRAANAVVSLAASQGTFQGAPAGTITLGGGETASATALYRAGGHGTAVLSATYGSVTAFATVRAVREPRIAPHGGTLFPGQTYELVVLSDGELASCQATPNADLKAFAMSGAAIGASPTPVADGAGDAFVTVEALGEGPATIELTCRDVWGQSDSAIFTLAPL